MTHRLAVFALAAALVLPASASASASLSTGDPDAVCAASSLVDRGATKREVFRAQRVQGACREIGDKREEAQEVYDDLMAAKIQLKRFDGRLRQARAWTDRYERIARKSNSPRYRAAAENLRRVVAMAEGRRADLQLEVRALAAELTDLDDRIEELEDRVVEVATGMARAPR